MSQNMTTKPVIFKPSISHISEEVLINSENCLVTCEQRTAQSKNE